jgi:hypothetical protein
MVAVGCSWTWGHSIKSYETYPAHLQNCLKDWQVINAGHCGADIDYTIFSAFNLIETQKVDFIIFQLSTLDRITLGTDGFDNFLDNKYFNGKDESIYYESKNDKFQRVIGIADNAKTKYTDGSYSAEDKFKHDEFKHSGMKNLNYKKYRNFVSVLTENVSYSTYKFQKTFSNLVIFENYLKKHNIKSLYFSYLPLPNDILESNFFLKFKNSVNYIEENWKSWLERTYPSNDFYIDRSHINHAGNKILAEEYLIPYIEKLL